MYAVITGASSGFGIEFARQFAKRGYDLCIAARRKDKLLELRDEIESRYKVNVDVISVDLSQEQGILQLYETTRSKNADVLVNNAGFATGGMPGKIDLHEEIRMLDINVRAVHQLTRLFLSDMMSRNSGRILNVASLSAWLPVPVLSAYAAGKAYILHLSEGINFELKKMKSNVRISVVTPGFYKTGIAGDHAEITHGSSSVSEFIAVVVKRFLKGKEIIIVGRDTRILLLTRFALRSIAKRIIFSFVRKSLVDPSHTYH